MPTKLPEAPLFGSPEKHNADIWRADRREIVAAKLSSHAYGNEGLFLDADGWTFERFERSGEMASVPFLRMSKDGSTIETSLRSFDWVEFGEVIP